MTAISGDIVLVGGGRMGGALAAGWLRGPLEGARLVIVEPDDGGGPASRRPRRHVRAAPDALPGGLRPAAIVFAVKPQVMGAVVPHYAGIGGPGTVHLSIAAGWPVSLLERDLGAVAVVRAMPNTPAAIGEGMTVAWANRAASRDQRALCEALLGAVGAVAWIDDEALMDAVTAVSGSGPAYVFLLAECLAEAAVDAGLPADLARTLAERTVSGAGALAGPVGGAPRHAAAQRDQPGRHDRSRALGPHGRRRARPPHAPRGPRRRRALPRPRP